MTRENFTSINIIVDASGSMAHLTHDTIGGLNTFLEDQKKVEGEAVVTLCTFNTDYRLAHDFVKLASVPSVTSQLYQPQGGTALLDAVGTTIDSVGRKLAHMPEHERPSKVIFLIITDGFENASRRYTASQIKTMVEHQKNTYSWEFVFMGANIDAFTEGTNLGITGSNTLNYAPTSAGTHQLYRSVSSNMSSYRGSTSSRADNFFDLAQSQGQTQLQGSSQSPQPPTVQQTIVVNPPPAPSTKK